MSVGRIPQQITAGVTNGNSGGGEPFVMLKYLDIGTLAYWEGITDLNDVVQWNTALNNYGSDVNFTAVEILYNSVIRFYGNLQEITTLIAPSDGGLMDCEFSAATNCEHFEGVSGNLTSFTQANYGNCPLKRLRLDNNKITNLDISALSLLESCTLSYNQLTEFTVQHPNLEFLDCSFNQIAGFQIVESALQTLFVQENQIASEKFPSDAPDLRTLVCGLNYFENLDFYANTKLTSLTIEGHHVLFKQLDLSASSRLTLVSATNIGLEKILFYNAWIIGPAVNVYLYDNALNKVNLTDVLTFFHTRLPLAVGKLYLQGGTNYSILGEPVLISMYNDLEAAGVDVMIKPYD